MAKKIKLIWMDSLSLQKKEIYIQDDQSNQWYKTKLTDLGGNKGYSYSFEKTNTPSLSSKGNPNLYDASITEGEFNVYHQDGMTFEMVQMALSKFK